jgi:hypothetical protein
MIPGWLIALVTFPGVIVHEMGHQFFCRRYRLPVYSVCYFRLGNPAGYVIHEQTDSYPQSFWISVGPLIVNTLVAIAVGFPVAISVLTLRTATPLQWGLAWLAVSIGMHAFPSSGDAKNLWTKSKQARSEGHLAAYIGFPMVIFIRFANLASMLWFDAIYAVCVVGFIPTLVVRLLAGV